MCVLPFEFDDVEDAPELLPPPPIKLPMRSKGPPPPDPLPPPNKFDTSENTVTAVWMKLPTSSPPCLKNIDNSIDLPIPKFSWSR